jgi:hypothetical protein
MCGLFGFSGDPKIFDKNIAKAIMAKIKILGIYNIDRGKHSCGLYVEGNLYHGVSEDKVWSDFIQNNHTPLPGSTEYGNLVIIGHTRHATGGAHTKDNAHPFMVQNELVLAHNGVISNAWTLCNKYKINHTDIHVDSKGLAMLVHQEGFKILNEYEGFAALLMTKLSEPNSLYMYRGVSKRTWNGTEEEERPLYYMQSEEGIYVSSIEKSLLAISDSSYDKIKVVEGNIVHKITNGKMTKSKFPVDRAHTVNYKSGGSCAVNHNVPKTTGTGATRNANCTNNTTGNTGTNCGASSVPNPSQSHATNFASSMESVIVPLIFHETLPARIDRYTNGVCGIFYHMGRYWIVDNDEIKIAHGEYYINKKGVVKSYKNKDNHNYFFFEGVMLRNEKCYIAIQEDLDVKSNEFNFAMTISKYAEFPVCNSRSDINTRCKKVSDYPKYRWYLNDKMVGNHGFTPKWSDRNYTIRDGLTHSIASQQTMGLKETTIDIENLKAEREGLQKQKETGVGTKAPVVMLPAIKDMAQMSMRFKEDVSECDLTRFYQTFDSLEEARNSFFMVEINAMRYYVADIMIAEMDITPETIFDDVVDVQLNMFLQLCIDNSTCVNDMWDAQGFNDIPHYLMVAENSKDGRIFDEPRLRNMIPTIPGASAVLVNDSAGEALTIPAKDFSDTKAYSLSKPSVVEVDTLPEGVEDRFPFCGGDGVDDNDNEHIIDMAIAREQASVPSDDDRFTGVVDELNDEEDDEEGEKKVPLEQVCPDEEKQYHFQDVVDFTGDVRDLAGELTKYEDDEFCQDVANMIYRHVDPLFHALREVCEKHDEEELGAYLNHNIKERVGL